MATAVRLGVEKRFWSTIGTDRPQGVGRLQVLAAEAQFQRCAETCSASKQADSTLGVGRTRRQVARLLAACSPDLIFALRIRCIGETLSHRGDCLSALLGFRSIELQQKGSVFSEGARFKSMHDRYTSAHICVGVWASVAAGMLGTMAQHTTAFSILSGVGPGPRPCFRSFPRSVPSVQSCINIAQGMRCCVISRLPLAPAYTNEARTGPFAQPTGRTYRTNAHASTQARHSHAAALR